MEDEIDYIAIATDGDLPGMMNCEIMMPVKTKKVLRLWRNFNSLKDIFHRAYRLMHECEAPKKECEILSRSALVAYHVAAEELEEYYGSGQYPSSEWSKWHTRSKWIVRHRKTGELIDKPWMTIHAADVVTLLYPTATGERQWL